MQSIPMLSHFLPIYQGIAKAFFISRKNSYLNPRQSRWQKTFVLLLPFLIIINTLGAKSIPGDTLKVPRIQNLDFDGRLSEPFWGELETLKFIRFSPNYPGIPTEKLDAYLVYDDKYLYLAGRMYVSDPDFIRGQSYLRDADNPSTDYFGLVIDSYNDNENAVAFFTSPTGLRWDAAISEDAASENSLSANWNTYWDALTDVTDHFYDVEIRIPWSSLKFEPKDNNVVMGVSMWRYLAAKNEVSQYPDISPDMGEMANMKPSLFRKVQFGDIQSAKPVYLTPYLLAGQQRQTVLNESETGFDREQDLDLNAGLDVKYNLTSNLTLDLSINTDFAQVESDDEQINLTRYQLFRPEKRQFFQERASLFDFRFNYVNHLFYSRNIGLVEGRTVPILGGVRLTGKIGDMDVGIIHMQTAKEGAGFLGAFSSDQISDNFSVIRLKQQVLNPYSYIGGMLTHKMDFRGDYNTAYGLDGVFRLWGNDYLTMKWAQTFEDSVNVNPFSLDAVRFYIGLERRIFSGFSFNFNTGNSGARYNPEMGFTSRNNYVFTSGNLRYGYLFSENSRWQQLSINSGAWADFNHAISNFDQSEAFLGIFLQAKKAWGVNLSFNYNFDKLTEALQISEGIAIPEGDYHHPRVSLSYQSPYNARSKINLSYNVGKYFDGIIHSMDIEPHWNPNAHLEMGGAYEIRRIYFGQRDDLLLSHIFRIRALYMLNARLSASAFLQYNNASRLFISNIRLRYNPREGNDLYIVFNEVLNADRNREGVMPVYPLVNSEVIALKYTYTIKM